MTTMMLCEPPLKPPARIASTKASAPSTSGRKKKAGADSTRLMAITRRRSKRSAMPPINTPAMPEAIQKELVMRPYCAGDHPFA